MNLLVTRHSQTPKLKKQIKNNKSLKVEVTQIKRELKGSLKELKSSQKERNANEHNFVKKIDILEMKVKN